MANVKHNIIANYLGQVWTGLLALAFIPLYIEYLGMEAYGLIALFAVIQSSLMLLDAGMTPTLNREMARFRAGVHSPQSIRELLHSLEVICCGLAMLTIAGLWLASPYLASDWLKADYLSVDVVTNALVIMGFIVGMRLCEGIYRGSLYGLEQQVWYNAVYSLLTTLRYGGALAILAWISASVNVFFLWQAAISLLTVVIFAYRVNQALPEVFLPVKFSWSALAQVWKFAGGMMSITFLTMILLQSDKLLLSRLLSLTDFGYYALAAAAASILYMIIVPVTQAVYPRIVSFATIQSNPDLIRLYHQISQLIVVLISPAAMLLCFFSGGVIYVWSGSLSLVNNAAPILSILAVGSFLNSLSYLPYQVQIAHGWTGLLFKIHLLIVLTLVSLIYIVFPRFGAEGAAWIWLLINAAYLAISSHFMHRKLLVNEKWRWYFFDLVLPTLGVVIVMYLAQLIQPQGYQSRLDWIFFLTVTGVVAVLTSSMLARTIFLQVHSYFWMQNNNTEPK